MVLFTSQQQNRKWSRLHYFIHNVRCDPVPNQNHAIGHEGDIPLPLSSVWYWKQMSIKEVYYDHQFVSEDCPIIVEVLEVPCGVIRKYLPSDCFGQSLNEPHL